MKKIVFSLIILSLVSSLNAQWLGTNPVYFNGGNVGIGTSSPWAPLTINSTSTITGNTGVALAFSGHNLPEIGFRFRANGLNFYQVIYNGSSIQWRNWDGSAYTPRLTLTNAGYLGIGTNSPTSKLQIEGDVLIKSGEKLSWGGTQTAIEGSTVSNKIAFFTNNTERLRVDDGGYVGIGTTSPSNKLQIGSNPTGYANNDFVVSNGNGSTAIHNDPDNTYFYTNRAIALRPGGSIALWAKENGNIGIGTTSPTEKLSVNGNVLAKKVRVSINAADWPDYVFNTNYKLRSLGDLEAYIKSNNHLPDVPSAKEVATNGLDLGNMDATLLKKVEELTLYLIQENKEKDELKKENKVLKETLAEVLKRLEKLEKK